MRFETKVAEVQMSGKLDDGNTVLQTAEERKEEKGNGREEISGSIKSPQAGLGGSLGG